MKLYRKMNEDADGRPAVGNTSMKLGVRPTNPLEPNKQFDVPAINGSDIVAPGDGGLSCYSELKDIRIRSKKLVLFSIEEAQLPQELMVRPDSGSHCMIEPRQSITLDVLQELLASTRELWMREETSET